MGVSHASVALDATVIEKHFKLDRNECGVDSAFSIEPNLLKQLVVESERVWQSLGKITYGPTRSEEKSFQFRRSLYIVENLKAGDRLTKDNVMAIRPGLPPEICRYDSGYVGNKGHKKRNGPVLGGSSIKTYISWAIINNANNNQ